MKTRLILIVFAALFNVAALTAKNIKTVVLKADKISCSNCENTIKKNIRFEKGVKTISVDIPTKIVTIEYDADKNNLESLEAAFDKIGFPAYEYAPESASKTVVFKADQMACGGCAAKVKKNISAEEGVSNVDVDLATKAVTITYDETKTDPAKLKEAFKKFEYNVVEFDPSAAVPTKEAAATPAPSGDEQFTYFKAIQIGCGGCAAKVNSNISAEEGVIEVAADAATKVVKIGYDPAKTDPAKLKDAFKKFEYTVNSYSPESANIAYVSFDAQQMKCGGCANKVTKNISAESGVKDVNVNLATKAVSIAYDETVTSPEQLAAAFKKFDYDVIEIYNKNKK